MSYNVDSVEIVAGGLSIKPRDALRLLHEHQDSLPSTNFLDELKVVADRELEYGDTGNTITVPNCSWIGEGSGYSYRDVFLAHVVPRLIGAADLVFIWEGRDSVTGLRIKDGKAVECDVKYTLVEK